MREESDSASTSSPTERPQTPFGRCLVDGDPATAANRRRNRRKALGISLVIEGALLAVVVMLPLMTRAELPNVKWSDPIPLAIGRPTGHRAGPRPKPINRPSQIIHDRFTIFPVPSALPPTTPPPDETGAEAPSGDQLFSGPIGPGTGAVFDSRPATPIAPPPEEPRRLPEKRPLKTSEGVQEAQLISRVQPCYPPLAAQIHLQGNVVLHAIISREGRITSLEVLSGHPLFVQCALNAVQQWRYRPTILNGEPVEVDTTITVIFRFKE